MKTIIKASLLFAALFGSSLTSFGMGRPAQIFETPSEAAIWDHSSAFYLRMDLENLADLKNEKFVWAGFQFDGTGFTGEIVADQFGQNERRFPAKAMLLHSTASGQYYLIEVLGADGNVIKEFFLKGPASDLPTR